MLSKGTHLILITTILIASTTALPIPRSVVCHPTTWHDIVVFFVANYIAHAATIPTAPGAKWYDTALWTILSLLLPFAGLGKSLGLLVRHFGVGSSYLEKAWARDALAIVVRSGDWEPSADPEEIYVKLPPDFHELDESPAILPSATITIDDTSVFAKVACKHVQIHGEMRLPKGYHLAYPDVGGLLPEIFPFNSPLNKNAPLSRSQSWLKMAISIAQLGYSSATVYQTRGSQLDRYGYAAFGLSVFPYAFMSLANLICIGLVGEYPSLYVLRTGIMDEAEERGGSFNGAVGIYREKRGSGGQRQHMTKAAQGDWGEFTRATLSMEVKDREPDYVQSKEDDEYSQERLGLLKGDGDRSQKILVVTVNEVTRRFVYQPSGEVGLSFVVSSCGNQDHIPDGGHVDELSSTRSAAILVGLLVAVLASLILPYIVILVFSRFEVGSSTFAQRAWMMSWASSSQLSLLSFGLVAAVFPHFSLSTFKETIFNYTGGRQVFMLVLFLPSLFLLPIPAIGGFVTVGQMLKEFGTCSLKSA
ncbi:hypothetical protein JAAARDRAFT_40601 [Jaapia argillacea MUCL 33604]|uniref:Uncharacterized protein n=1 Tax=Jaapia argillacea MUCL 33604 TaxID=933084 RepID=A0A067PAR3_9AGAM|nr:hypothetical protein JAAARDRAFT_40601 [Jaapia argillacea MUCL 33604]